MPLRAKPMLGWDWRRRTRGPGEKLALGNASLELRHELVRIERDADRVRRERLADHVSVGLFRGGEAVDLELQAIAVRIPVVQGQRRPVPDRPVWLDASCFSRL